MRSRRKLEYASLRCISARYQAQSRVKIDSRKIAQIRTEGCSPDKPNFGSSCGTFRGLSGRATDVSVRGSHVGPRFLFFSLFDTSSFWAFFKFYFTFSPRDRRGWHRCRCHRKQRDRFAQPRTTASWRCAIGGSIHGKASRRHSSEGEGLLLLFGSALSIAARAAILRPTRGGRCYARQWTRVTWRNAPVCLQS